MKIENSTPGDAPDIFPLPAKAIEDLSVQVQLKQFFEACHAFLGASVAGVVWRQANGELIHRCSRPSIREPAEDDALFSSMLDHGGALVVPNLRNSDDFLHSVLVTRALPLRTVVSQPFSIVGVDGGGAVYVGTLASVQVSDRWVSRLGLLASWAKFIFAVYFLSESQERLTEALQVTHVQAHTDDMTRIWNRKGILQLLDRELHRSQREKLLVSVLFVDMDNLKYINDNHGHAAGDEAIRKTAQTLLGGLRESDAVGRFGGDEFLVVLVDATRDGVQLVADRLMQSIKSAVFSHNDTDIALAASMGLAISSSENPLRADMLISRADKAVYAAKDRGRGVVVHYDEIVSEDD